MKSSFTKMQRRVCGTFFIFLSCFSWMIAGQLIDGIFTEPTLKPGYNLVATIPKGASSLNVTELERTPNYLAIRLQNGTYLINGNYNINWSGEYKAVGTTFVYLRQSPQQLESFSAPGPIQEPIDVMILYQEPNPGIVYRYVMPSIDLPVKSSYGTTPAVHFPSTSSNDSHLKRNENIGIFDGETRKDPPRRYRRRKFAWKVVGLTECSKACGGGFQTMRYVCVREHNQQQVPEKRCHALEKPALIQLRCNVEPCAAKVRWKPGPWSDCSVTCGKGTQTRIFECVDLTTGLTTEDDLCTEPTTLPDVQSCHMPKCEDTTKLHRHAFVSSGWTTGPWSQCSVTCGPGTRSRIVLCSFHEKSCDYDKIPSAQEDCDSGPCPAKDFPTKDVPENNYESAWLYTEWSEQCSADCGTGVQTRRAICATSFFNGSSICDEENRPETERACSSDKTCSGQWFTGPWTRCFPVCDVGEQRRDVVCVTTLRGSLRVVLDMNCPAIKPETRKFCRGPPCSSDWFTSDWSQCSKSCGKGVQKRQVHCLSPNGRPAESQCREEEKPMNRRICNDFPCKPLFHTKETQEHSRPVQIQDDSEISNGLDLDPTCKDSIENCNLVMQARLCRYQFYQKSCCLSCSIMKHDYE